MLLQSQELANLSNNNTSSNVNLKSPELVNISKKFTEEKSKNDSYSLADFQNETLEQKSKNIKRRQSLKPKQSFMHKNSLKKTMINPLFFLEDINESINGLIILFLEKHSNQDKVTDFRKKFPDIKGANTLIKILEEFEEFSFFDLIGSVEYIASDDEKKKKFLIDRNNFFLRVLIILDELNYRVDDLVNTFVMRYTEAIPEIEVDYFFLSYYDYRDKAEALEIRHNEYFRSLLANCSFEEGKRFFKNYNPRAYISKSSGEHNTTNIISDVEYNFVKYVVLSCIRRGFHEGIM